MSKPDTIFHYTDSAGLIGILSANPEERAPGGVGPIGRQPEFRATAVEYLNDSRELIHGLAIIRDDLLDRAVRDLRRRSSRYGDISKFVAERKAAFLAALCEIIDEVERRNYPRHIHCYVTSFSEKPDLLSQWRGYCGGLNGFAIGIDVSQLPDNAELKLKQVKYSRHLGDSNEVLSFANEWISRFVYAGGNVPEITAQIMDQYLRQLAVFATQFKHDGFSEEVEWRMIQRGSDGANYRSRGTQIVPYATWRLAAEAVVGVYVGPGPNQHENLLAVKGALNSYGYHTAAENVVPSVTPFR